jgi:hypothetical protein
MDFASRPQALVKVRVRVDTTLSVDYLSFHLIGGVWLVTASLSTSKSALNRKRHRVPIRH